MLTLNFCSHEFLKDVVKKLVMTMRESWQTDPLVTSEDMLTLGRISLMPLSLVVLLVAFRPTKLPPSLENLQLEKPSSVWEWLGPSSLRIKTQE